MLGMQLLSTAATSHFCVSYNTANSFKEGPCHDHLHPSPTLCLAILNIGEVLNKTLA